MYKGVELIQPTSKRSVENSTGVVKGIVAEGYVAVTIDDRVRLYERKRYGNGGCEGPGCDVDESVFDLVDCQANDAAILTGRKPKPNLPRLPPDHGPPRPVGMSHGTTMAVNRISAVARFVFRGDGEKFTAIHLMSFRRN